MRALGALGHRGVGQGAETVSRPRTKQAGDTMNTAGWLLLAFGLVLAFILGVTQDVLTVGGTGFNWVLAAIVFGSFLVAGCVLLAAAELVLAIEESKGTTDSP